MKTTSIQYAKSIIYYLRYIAQISPRIIDSIEHSYLSKHKQRISIDSYAKLLIEAEKITDDSLFGFSLGQHIQTTDYGVLGYLVESCENLHQAVNSLLAFDGLVAELGHAQFQTTDDSAIVVWHPYHTDEKQVILRNMTAWVATVRKLLFNSVAPHEMTFTFNIDKDARERLALWFNCSVSGNCKSNSIKFAKELLQLPFRSNNQRLFQTLKQESTRQLTEFTCINNVKHQVESMLAAKSDLSHCSQQDIASALNVSCRTLQRKLKQQDINFITLLNQERKKRVKLLLSQYSLSEVACLLGYKEQATLTKAVKLWFGLTPKQLKKMAEITL